MGFSIYLAVPKDRWPKRKAHLWSLQQARARSCCAHAMGPRGSPSRQHIHAPSRRDFSQKHTTTHGTTPNQIVSSKRTSTVLGFFYSPPKNKYIGFPKGISFSRGPFSGPVMFVVLGCVHGENHNSHDLTKCPSGKSHGVFLAASATPQAPAESVRRE